MTSTLSRAALVSAVFAANAASADLFFNTDGSIQGSLCVGDDCITNEVFGNDTLRLKGLDLRIHFDDTSTDVNFSQNDWRLLVNSDATFGANFFAVEDTTAGTVPFRIKSGATDNTLVVDSTEILGVGTVPRVGVGTDSPQSPLHVFETFSALIRLETNQPSTGKYEWFMGSTSNIFGINDVTGSTFNNIFEIQGGGDPNRVFMMAQNRNFGFNERSPMMELHVSSEDTPTLRLQQDVSPGVEGATWDIGGNEANFFVRDAETDDLPFRIRPGAPDDALYIAANGEIGMGIPNPRGALHIRRNQPNNVPHLIVQTRRTDGRAEIWFEDNNTSSANDALRLQLNGDVFNVSFNGTGGAELAITKTGDVRVPRGNLVVPTGGVIVGGQTLNVPDYVFAPDYELMPLDDVALFIDAHSHLPHIPSAKEVAANGLDIASMQMGLLKTVEEQTLYILRQEQKIQRQDALLAEVLARLARLESPVPDAEPAE